MDLPTSPLLPQLRQVMADHFSLEELEMLAFDLGVDWDELGGTTKSGKLLQLLLYLDRNGRLADLEADLREKRPSYSWRELFVTAQPALPLPNEQLAIAHFKRVKNRFSLISDYRPFPNHFMSS